MSATLPLPSVPARGGTTYRTCPRSGLQFEAQAEKLMIANAVIAVVALLVGGILAIGAIEDKVVVAPGGGYETRKKLRVTMSCDHRVIDGAVGAKFLQTLRRLIENPLMLVF